MLGVVTFQFMPFCIRERFELRDGPCSESSLQPREAGVALRALVRLLGRGFRSEPLTHFLLKDLAATISAMQSF